MSTSVTTHWAGHTSERTFTLVRFKRKGRPLTKAHRIDDTRRDKRHTCCGIVVPNDSTMIVRVEDLTRERMTMIAPLAARHEQCRKCFIEKEGQE